LDRRRRPAASPEEQGEGGEGDPMTAAETRHRAR
jgi:hypothetical protein